MTATGNSPPVDDAALYVYCVTRDGGRHAFDASGLDGRPVRVVSNGTICAVVHDCPAEPYQSRDPNTVEAWVAAHHDVVLAASEVFDAVLPMSFDMIVRGASDQPAAGALKAWLDQGQERYCRLLDKLAGKAEYGVQVYWDREAIAAALVQADKSLRAMQDEARAKSKGMAHLLRQQLAKVVGEVMEKQAEMFARDFYTRIRQCVEDVRIDKLKRSDGETQMLLNLSCLAKAGGGDLGKVLDEIQAVEGVSVRFIGPWPPYSFVGG